MDSNEMQDKVVYDHGYTKIILRSYVDGEGETSEWGMVHINSFGKGGLVLALTKDNELILERSFRIPLKSDVYELPGGLNDIENESPLAVAKRELLEETGCVGEEWEEVATFAESPGLSDQVSVLYIARNVTKIAEPILGASEEITVVTIPVNEVRTFLQKSEILVDAKVYAALAFLDK